MEEIRHKSTKNQIDKYPKDVRKILLDDKYTKLNSKYAGKVKKLHIIHCSKKLQIIFYPRLYKNIHYSVDDYSEVTILMKRASKLSISVKEYFADQDYTDMTKNECIVINDIENESEVLRFTNITSLINNIDSQPMCKKKYADSM